MSKPQRVLSRLMEGKSISAGEAYNWYGITENNLTTIVSRLRSAGHQVVTSVTAKGTTRYSL